MNDEKKMTCAENAELAMLTAEVARLERENETLRKALSAFGVEINEIIELLDQAIAAAKGE